MHKGLHWDIETGPGAPECFSLPASGAKWEKNFYRGLGCAFLEGEGSALGFSGFWGCGALRGVGVVELGFHRWCCENSRPTTPLLQQLLRGAIGTGTVLAALFRVESAWRSTRFATLLQ